MSLPFIFFRSSAGFPPPAIAKEPPPSKGSRRFVLPTATTGLMGGLIDETRRQAQDLVDSRPQPRVFVDE